MQESFQPYELFDFLWQRRKLIAVVPVLAALLALAVSLVLPNKYTATATILIEPPGGSDPRVATAVSPVYLESLRTYEQFASSDSLFARACEKFHLLPPSGGPGMASFKKRVLRVQKLKETKVLQISATLSDAKQAQALVQFLAEQTAALSRSISRDSEQDTLQTARKQVDDSAAALDRVEKEWTSVAGANSDTSLQAQIESLSASRLELDQQVSIAATDIADYEARDGSAQDRDSIRQQLASSRAKLNALNKQKAAIENEISAKTAAMAQWLARKQTADLAVRNAQTAHELALKRASDVEASTGLRAEQLRIIDPGVIPERPSSPDIPLNCGAAFLLGAMAVISAFTLRFALERSRAQAARSGFRVARGAER